jgi:hypothetical protein
MLYSSLSLILSSYLLTSRRIVNVYICIALKISDNNKMHLACYYLQVIATPVKCQGLPKTKILPHPCKLVLAHRVAAVTFCRHGMAV